MAEDPNILDLPYQTFHKLCLILNNKNTMQTFLEVVPPFFCSPELVERMEIEGQTPCMTPAKYLLQDLGRRNVCVSTFVNWLEAASLERALVLLKNDEPLKIIKQPPSLLKIQEGSCLTIKCKATSFPSPEYQWFKGEDELPLQQESELLIRSTSLEDCGLYVCRVHTQSIQTGSFSYVFSDPTNVEIVAPTFQNMIPFSKNMIRLKNEENFEDSFERESTSDQNHIVDGLPLDKTLCTKIEILKHPKSPGKIAQGSSVCLDCEVMSNFPISYRWFLNGRCIKDEISSELKLKNIYPDPCTGETKWEYQCQVYNAFDTVNSKCAVVELEAADENTPCYAEEKLAFLVANNTYENLENLKSPGNDAAVLAEQLSLMNFKIFALNNLNLTEMKNALHYFCKTLKPNVYALFYFAGHGFDLRGQTYLQPVDCSGLGLPHESLCAEYVLQCMQEAIPAANIMLIDTCRKLPPDHHINQRMSPGKTYEPKMKRNTIYGYSTSFLYGSHENDAEPNGFFIKYLKKYICQKKRIQEILWMVQRDFETDPLTQNLQFPWVSSSLCPPIKFCDPVIQEKPSLFDCTLQWADIKSPVYEDVTYSMPKLGVSIHLEFRHHINVFCNGIDVLLYLDLKQDASLKAVSNLEVDMDFSSDQLQVISTPAINKTLKLNHRNYLFKKQVLHLQKTQGTLESQILMINRQTKAVLKILPLLLDTTKIAQLRLPVNQLQSRNIECNEEMSDLKKYSVSKNNVDDLMKFDDVPKHSDRESKCLSIEENGGICSFSCHNK